MTPFWKSFWRALRDYAAGRDYDVDTLASGTLRIGAALAMLSMTGILIWLLIIEPGWDGLAYLVILIILFGLPALRRFNQWRQSRHSSHGDK